MGYFFENVWLGIRQTSWLEWIAVLTGVLYVLLAAYRKMACWIFAFISSVIYVYLCVQFDLFIESILQSFYVVMAVVGWLTWKRASELKPVSEELLDDIKTFIPEIKTWSVSQHILNIAISGLLAFLMGYLFEEYTDQANPYMDAFTTCFSLSATFMVTKKVLENWLYWIVIDAVSIGLYSSRGLQLSAVLYMLFTILATVGFISWYKQWRKYKMA